MRRKKPTPSVGQWVRVKFFDHVEGSDDVAEYYVSGRVAKVTQKAYTIDAWARVDPRHDRESDRENITSYTILRAVIDEVHIFPEPQDE